MRILLSGVTGYVGSAVASACVKAGHQVVGLSRKAPTHDDGVDPNVERVMGDAFHAETILELMRSADVYVETAGTDMRDEGGVALFSRLLEGIAGQGKTIVQTSGTGVLSRPAPEGEWCDDSPDEDSDDLRPPAPLAERVRVEKIMRGAADQVRTLIIRPPQVWGHGGSKQIPALFEGVRLTGAACYVGRGQHCYSNIHVDDLAQLFVRVIERGRSGATYHGVAGEENWRSIARAVSQVMECPTRSVTLAEAADIWGERSAKLFFGVCSRSQSGRTKTELEWAPQHRDIIDDIVHGSYRARFEPHPSSLAEAERNVQ